MGWDTLNLITTRRLVPVRARRAAAADQRRRQPAPRRRRRGRIRGTRRRWNGRSPSPPPPYNFRVIPHVASRHPLWEDRLQESDERSLLEDGMVLDHGRETVGTTPLDGEPDVILRMPEDSYAPFLLALAASAGFCRAAAAPVVARSGRGRRRRRSLC